MRHLKIFDHYFMDTSFYNSTNNGNNNSNAHFVFNKLYSEILLGTIEVILGV